MDLLQCHSRPTCTGTRAGKNASFFSDDFFGVPFQSIVSNIQNTIYLIKIDTVSHCLEQHQSVQELYVMDQNRVMRSSTVVWPWFCRHQSLCSDSRVPPTSSWLSEMTVLKRKIFLTMCMYA